MARHSRTAPEKLYIGLQVTYTQEDGEADRISWHWVGPYMTAAAAKGQMQEMAERDLYEDDYLYYWAEKRGKVVGRTRTDRIVLEATPDWKPVK